MSCFRFITVGVELAEALFASIAVADNLGCLISRLTFKNYNIASKALSTCEKVKWTLRILCCEYNDVLISNEVVFL